MTGFTDSGAVIDGICTRTGREERLVTEVLRDQRFIIDSFVADDWSVLIGPFHFWRRGDPVVHAIADHFTDEDWRDPYGLKTAPPEHLAKALHLNLDQVHAHPVAFGVHVLAELARLRGVDPDDPHGMSTLQEIHYAWRDEMGSRNECYRVSTVGLERDLEDWIEANVELLPRLGYSATLVRRQVRLDGGRSIADMLFQFSEAHDDFHAGDLLVVENKAGPVGVKAADQLRRYVELVRSELAPPQSAVFGLLIADGVDVALQNRLKDEGFGYVSLVDLGYRRHLHEHHRLAQALDADVTTDLSVFEPAAAPFPNEEPSVAGR